MFDVVSRSILDLGEASRPTFFPAAGVDETFLSGVQGSFAGLGVESDLTTLLPAILILVAIILLLLALWKLFKPAEYSLAKRKVDQIVIPADIREIIERSVTLRAMYEIEVFDKAYKQIYKGQILGINERGELEVEIPIFQDVSLDFRDKDIHAAFRMSRFGKQEFFQFDSVSKGLGRGLISHQKERVLFLSMPRGLEIGQKRRYIRIRPRGAFQFSVYLLAPAIAANPMPLKELRRLHVTEADDVSVGGLRLVVTARTSEIRVQAGQDIYAHFRLPLAGLNVKDMVPDLIVQVKVVSVARQATGRKVMSSQAVEKTPAPHYIRLMFTGRGQVNRKEQNVSFRPFTTLLFDDLGHWIQAYQRFKIQEEKGTGSKPLHVANVYAKKPPATPQKYPAQPPKRTPVGPGPARKDEKDEKDDETR
ncbi:MAG: hypothetical protein V1816_14670 [Pseudomonadota bacterium]